MVEAGGAGAAMTVATVRALAAEAVVTVVEAATVTVAVGPTAGVAGVEAAAVVRAAPEAEAAPAGVAVSDPGTAGAATRMANADAVAAVVVVDVPSVLPVPEGAALSITHVEKV